MTFQDLMAGPPPTPPLAQTAAWLDLADAFPHASEPLRRAAQVLQHLILLGEADRGAGGELGDDLALLGRQSGRGVTHRERLPRYRIGASPWEPTSTK